MKTLTRFIIASTALVLLNTSAFAQTVEEVTVTAARQEQSVQDVAISVQAITSEDLQLQHIETADDLASTVPGFDFTEALGSGVLLKIRGLSFATIGAAGTQPAVTAQNGHQIGNRPFSTIGFYDADRIEILEGPQGTLYGRNSTTGLVNFITAKPGADQYVTLTAGADGLAQVKFATDFELSDSTVMRIAGTKLDIDPVVLNTGTGNGVDDRDSYGIRTTIETAMDERNTLTFQLEKTAVNDNRLNYGLSACNRDAFFGCNPLTQDFSPHLNRPTMSSGTIANQFNLLTNINNDNLDLFADTDASRVNSIDQINKDIDSQRKDNFEMASLTNVSELDNMTVTLKATYIDQDYYHLDDNDHSNATVGLNGALAPPTGLVIPELRTYCLGTMTNVANDFAVECSQVDTQSKQFEINLVSDFDGPFNFVAGAYNYQDNSRNQYSIQTAAYVLLNDFDQHPYSPLFGTYATTMNTYGGQAFFTNFGGTLAQLANPASTLVDGNGNNAVAATTAAVQAALAADATIAAAVGAGTFDLALFFAGDAAQAAAQQALTAQAATIALGATQAAAVAFLQDTAGPAITAACSATGTNVCVKSMPAEAGGLITDQRTQRDSQAIYGEFYWTPTDNFKVTLGARYMDDRFATTTMQGLSDTAYTGGAACLTADYEACYQQGSTGSVDKNEEATYKLALQYDYDQGMVYASYVTGNRPSGANPDATLYPSSESEQIEIGTRNILFDGAMRLNLTAFRQEVEDSQQSIIRFSSAYVEPHDLTHQGLQLNLQAFVTPTTILGINALATDSTFDTEAPSAATAYGSNAIVAGAAGYTYANGSMSLEPHNPTQAVSFQTVTRAQAEAILTGAATADGTAGSFIAVTGFVDANGAPVAAGTAGATPVIAPNMDDAMQAYCTPAFGAGICSVGMYSIATDAAGNETYLINSYGDVFALASNVSDTSAFGNANSTVGYAPALQGLGTFQVLQEIGGNMVPGTADLETNITLTQLYQAMGGSGSITLSYHYKDKTYGDIFNAERYAIPDTEYFNLNATYAPDNADWYLNLWARNIADKRYINSIARNSNLQGGNPFVTFDQGRKIGLDFGYNF